MTIRNSTEWLSMPIDSIKPYEAQLRRHSRRSLDKLKKLISHFGQVVPILIDAKRVIVDGHAVWLAMRELGSGEIATITVAGRTNPEVKALRLALNRLPSEATWNSENLRAEFEELVSLSFDLELTAFEMPEIDQVLDLDSTDANSPADEPYMRIAEGAPVSRSGDIWRCGSHQLGCGKGRDADFVARVAGWTLADVAFTAPWCADQITWTLDNKDRNDEYEFVPAAAGISVAQSTDYLIEALTILKANCSARALIFTCVDWRHIHQLLTAGMACPLELYSICVWAKGDAGPGPLYHDQHELVCVFQSQSSAERIQAAGRRHNRSNVWTYRATNTYGVHEAGRGSGQNLKPVPLIADVLRDVTKRGGAVLDTFMGTGSTLIAAEETGRRCFGVTHAPGHLDLAVRRWQAHTNRNAVHAVTGQLFNERGQQSHQENRHVE